MSYNRWIIYSDELYHHGVLGMKWGIRRYQNKNGTLTKAGRERLLSLSSEYKRKVKNDVALTKGQSFDRVGGKNETDKGSVFVSFTEKDKYRYRDIVEALPIGEAEVAKLKLKAITDVKAAGSKAQVETLLEYMGDYPISKDLRGIYAVTEESKKRNEKMWNRQLKKALNGDQEALEDIYDNAFSLFVNRKSNVSIEMTSRLQRKGYNAIVDLWDSGFADCPLYVFDRQKTLKTTKRSLLTMKERDYATEKVRSYN